MNPLRTVCKLLYSADACLSGSPRCLSISTPLVARDEKRPVPFGRSSSPARSNRPMSAPDLNNPCLVLRGRDTRHIRSAANHEGHHLV